MKDVNTKLLLGIVVLVITIGLSGYLLWSTFAAVPATAFNSLKPLPMTAAEMQTSPGITTLAQISASPDAQFTLPVARPDNVGKTNLFQ